MKLFVALFLCLFALSSHSRAATVSGVALPDVYPVDGQTLRLNGAGLRTVTFLGVHLLSPQSREDVAEFGLLDVEAGESDDVVMRSAGPAVFDVDDEDGDERSHLRSHRWSSERARR